MKSIPYSVRGGGLHLVPALPDATLGLGSGPDVSWLKRCIVGDDQGNDGACTIFALASWSEIVVGKAITNATCLAIYREALAALGRAPGNGLTFAEGFKFAPKAWFPGKTRIVNATLSHLAEQPLLGGYYVTPAWDAPNQAGCLNHRASAKNRGAHAVVVAACGSLPGKAGRWIYIENSWGVRWGWKGIGVMNETLHGRMCRELWRLV